MAIELISDFRFAHSGAAPSDNHTIGATRARLAGAFADRLFLSDGGAFLLTGYRGVGKTTFVQDVLRRLGDHIDENPHTGWNTADILLDVQLNIARPLTGVELMHYILRQLHNRLSDLGLLRKLPKPLRLQLRLAFLRTSAMLALKATEQAEASMSLESWLSLSSKVSTSTSKDITYLAYDERSAESDLILIARQLIKGFKPVSRLGMRWPFARPIRLKLVFVFDELDKIDESADNPSALTDILQALKTLFTTSGISFIFVAGRALHEHWHRDVQRGDSVYESVFSELRYLPAVWEQVDELCDPLVSQVEKLSDYDRQLYEDFKRYLAFSGRGIPRRILRSFYERIRWNGETATLTLSEQDRRQMRFHAELYLLLLDAERQILGDRSRELRPDWRDKQRLGILYLVDWILARGIADFGLDDLIDAASSLLKSSIAPTPDVAPSVATGLLEVLRDHGYVERFTEAGSSMPDEDQTRERYRLFERRLIEMGHYRETEYSPEPQPELPTLSDRYQLLELLGQGASAQVYQAIDRRTGRLVAVKWFNPDYASADSSLQERLQAEVRVQSRLQHPGIARFLEVSFEENTPYIVMDYLDGVSLNRMLAVEGGLPRERSLTIARALLETLDYLHANEIIWRDLKPSNVMITRDGTVVALDFGSSQIIRDSLAAPDTTRVGFVAGTPAYMSPEQMRGEALTPASDLFSLGVVLFEMLTGETPWPTSSPIELLRTAQSEPVETRPGWSTLPEPLRGVLARALAASAAARFQTAQEFRDALPADADDPGLADVAERVRKASDEVAPRVVDRTILTPAGSDAHPPGSGYDEWDMPSAPRSGVVDTKGPVPFPAAPAPSRARLAVRAPQEAGATEAVRELDPRQLTVPRAYPLLRVTLGGETRHFGLFGHKASIGRAAECDIHLNDTLVSRFHARLRRRGESYEVEDLNSINGLHVGGTRVYQRQVLQDGDRIELGDAVIVFRAPETVSTAPSQVDASD